MFNRSFYDTSTMHLCENLLFESSILKILVAIAFIKSFFIPLWLYVIIMIELFPALKDISQRSSFIISKRYRFFL